MPVPYTAAELKARFETGDVPTQQDFADLIDTLFHQLQQAEDTAESAAILAAKASKCYGMFTINYTSGVATAALAVERVEGCTIAAAFAYTNQVISSVSHRKVTATITITPTENFQDTKYAVITHPGWVESAGDAITGTAPTVVRNAGSCVITAILFFPFNVSGSKKLSFDIKP